MTTHIEIADWKLTSKGYKNKKTSEIIKEVKKGERHFEYYNENGEYLGRYNSEYGIFDDDIVLVALNSEY